MHNVSHMFYDLLIPIFCALEILSDMLNRMLLDFHFTVSRVFQKQS